MAQHRKQQKKRDTAPVRKADGTVNETATLIKTAHRSLHTGRTSGNAQDAPKRYKPGTELVSKLDVKKFRSRLWAGLLRKGPQT